MTLFRRCFLALCAVAVLAGVSARAGEGSEITITADVDWASKHIWRGITLSEDAVLQTGLTVESMGFSLGVWGNIDTGDGMGRENNYSKVEYHAGYSQAINDDLTLGGGVIHYDFPGNGAHTTEVYVTAALPNMVAAPKLLIAYDVDEAEGWYIGLSVSHKIGLENVHDGLALVLGASVGWASKDFTEFYSDADENTFFNVSPRAALEYTASESLSFDVFVAYDYLTDSHVRDGVRANGRRGDTFSFGTGITYKF
jgi:uncharacterized protein (TIGR02001 family)